MRNFGFFLVLVLELSIVGFCELLTHDEALDILDRAGISVTSRGNCIDADRTRQGCVSFTDVRSETLDGVIWLKEQCNCPITIEAGTETYMHLRGGGHHTGHKLDLVYYNAFGLNNYIESQEDIGKRSDGPQMYQDNIKGFIYAREGDPPHWDVDFNEIV